MSDENEFCVRDMESRKKQALAAEVVKICALMYQKGYIASSEGNVSVRLGPEQLLVTPRGRHKGFLKAKHLTVTDLDGHWVSGDSPPSSELQLHLQVYRERPDVNAVVHAHPTSAIACSLAGISLAEGMIPEVVTSLGAIPTIPYTTPGTAETAEGIRDIIHQFDVVILARHGSLSVGQELFEAYSKLEMLEHAAQILSLAQLLGPISPLPQQERERLLVAGGRKPADVIPLLHPMTGVKRMTKSPDTTDQQT